MSDSGHTTPARGAVAVIGAGAMGAGIAQVAAQAGHEVHLVDAQPGAATAAVERLAATLTTLEAKGKIPDAAAVTARLHVADALTSLPPCALVIEAVVERLDVKREIFAALDAAQPGALLATNTSSLDVTAIAEGLTDPRRVLGLHFFNPVPLMRLVEVIAGAASDPRALDRATDLMRAWGKTPVRCLSTPGFIVNRVARPFYGEAQRMVEQGLCDAATVDLALTAHGGFRMGPMALTDLIGHDVNYRVGESVWEQTGRDPRYEPTAIQRALVENGHLGTKTGRGFFAYPDGLSDAAPDEALAARLAAAEDPVRNPLLRTIAMLVNEGVDLVARGEATAADVDTAMRLGTNYPHGPHEWLAQYGAPRIVAALEALDAAHPGGRYRVSPALRDAAGRETR